MTNDALSTSWRMVMYACFPYCRCRISCRGENALYHANCVFVAALFRYHSFERQILARGFPRRRHASSLVFVPRGRHASSLVFCHARNGTEIKFEFSKVCLPASGASFHPYSIGFTPFVRAAPANARPPPDLPTSFRLVQPTCCQLRDL